MLCIYERRRHSYFCSHQKDIRRSLRLLCISRSIHPCSFKRNKPTGLYMKETTDQILALLKIAEIAAHKAGDYLLNKIGKAKVKDQKSTLDDLLDADLEAEQILL